MIKQRLFKQWYQKKTDMSCKILNVTQLDFHIFVSKQDNEIGGCTAQCTVTLIEDTCEIALILEQNGLLYSI